jgi:hypothetical protein
MGSGHLLAKKQLLRNPRLRAPGPVAESARPLRKLTISLPDKIRFGIAFSLAAMTTFLFFTAGLYGQAGAWLLGTIISTLVICFIGGLRRVFFAAVATVPPFILIYAAWIREAGFTSIVSEFIYHAGGFGLFVALPILIAYVAGRFDDWLRRNSWPPHPPRTKGILNGQNA